MRDAQVPRHNDQIYSHARRPLLALSAPAFAKTLKLPNEEFAIASIDIPDA
jgi:hypothetical protein